MPLSVWSLSFLSDKFQLLPSLYTFDANFHQPNAPASSKDAYFERHIPWKVWPHAKTWVVLEFQLVFCPLISFFFFSSLKKIQNFILKNFIYVISTPLLSPTPAMSSLLFKFSLSFSITVTHIWIYKGSLMSSFNVAHMHSCLGLTTYEQILY